jgi:hypothetical protein
MWLYSPSKKSQENGEKSHVILAMPLKPVKQTPVRYITREHEENDPEMIDERINEKG